MSYRFILSHFMICQKRPFCKMQKKATETDRRNSLFFAYHHLRSGVPQTINNTLLQEKYRQVFRLIVRRNYRLTYAFPENNPQWLTLHHVCLSYARITFITDKIRQRPCSGFAPDSLLGSAALLKRSAFAPIFRQIFIYLLFYHLADLLSRIILLIQVAKKM